MTVIKEIITEEYELNGIEIIFWQIPTLMFFTTFLITIITMGI